MGRLIYKKSVKAALFVLQAAAAGILCYCFLNIGFWMDGSDSIWEVTQKYEESDMFFQQVEMTVKNKIRGQQNNELFETDGVFDGTKEIDISSFGKTTSGVKDLNTTYLLEDLLEFGRNGGQTSLEEAVREAMLEEDRQGRSAGEQLDMQSETLETIRPVTGITLAECSRWYSDPAGFLLDIYMRLSKVCAEITERYEEYETWQEESWSQKAPSNIRYCIENSATGEIYTNLNAVDYEAAQKALAAEKGFVWLYEGDRSFNIMVANPEHVLNEAAEDWFVTERFVNTNERVLLAVNPEWPVSDGLQTYAQFYARWGDVVLVSGIMAAGCMLLLLAGLVLTLMAAGWTEGRCTLKLYRVDAVPTELMAGIYMIVGVIFFMLLIHLTPDGDLISGGNHIGISSAAALGYLIWLSACTGFMRRLRSRTLWSNSICYMLVRSWKQVTSARIMSGRFLLMYIGFFALNVLFLVFFGQVGVFLVLILDMVVLLYLLRDLVGKQSIWEGIHQISTGDLTYKIDTDALQGETLEMARAINDMGDGLQEAVQAIVKNERLKAELITNVSHDLKTPLTSIVNYVDLLKRENPPGEKVQHYIAVLEQKSQRLRQLTEDLVEASRISSGNIELEMMELPFSGILEQAYGEFQERFEEHGLKTVWKLEKEPLLIRADGAQLWRILENLFGNICKYAKEGTHLYIVLEKKEQRARLSLQNTSAQELTVEADELTARFVRGDRSRSTEGSGLGLSIAQNLAQLMGGSFQVQTDGDLFEAILEFPLVAAADAER